MLLLSVLLHVQTGRGLPTFRKGHISITTVLALCLDTLLGMKLSGTNEATVEIK